MKKILLLSCLLNTIISFSQTTPAIQWQKNFGGGSNEWIASSIQTSDGGFIAQGTTLSANGDATGNHGNYDVLLIKTDAAGSIQWKRCYGSSGFDNAGGILQTADGGYIIGATVTANDGDVSGCHGGGDYWLAKTDAAGNIQWQKCYGGSNSENLWKVKQASDGGYILAGNSFSSDGDVAGNKGLYDAWIVKTDATGTLQWQKNYGGSQNDLATDITETQNGDFIFCGGTYSSNGDLNINYGDKDMWLMRVSGINGNGIWSNSYGGSQYDDLNGITALAGDAINIAACGSTVSNNYNISGNHGSSDFLFITLDGNSGVLNSAQCYGGTGYDQAYSIANTFDKGYCISGISNSNDGDVNGNHGATDVWVLKLNQGGTIDWQKSLGGSNNERSFSIAETNDGGYLAGCASYSADGDIPNNYGGEDMWLVKLSPCFAPPVSSAFITPNSSACGGTVTMSVPGGIPYTYQWKKNNRNIAGATSRIYTATTAGNYTCVVSNGACGITNSPNTVSNQKLIATITPSGSVTKCAADVVNFSANTGADLTYLWYRNNVADPFGTSSTYNTTRAGNYKVKETNSITQCTAFSKITKVTINNCLANIETQNTAASVNTNVTLLYQNIPNPAINKTLIKYAVPLNCNAAYIIITDMVGKAIKQINITAKGNGTAIVDVSKIAAGVYNYSLYVDGIKTATKQMVLSK